MQQLRNDVKDYGVLKGWGIFLVCLFGFALIPILAVGAEDDALVYKILTAAFSAMIFVGIIMISSAKKLKKASIEENVEICDKIYKETCEPNIAAANSEIQKITNSMETFMREHKNLLDFLPEKYHTIMAISFMLESVKNLRADTLKEVINLYEQELHLLEQERILQNNVRMQQLQNQRMIYAMEQIKSNQEIIESNILDIKALQIVDMFRD